MRIPLIFIAVLLSLTAQVSSQKEGEPDNDLFGGFMKTFVDPVYDNIYQQVYEAEMQRILGSVGVDYKHLPPEKKQEIQAYEELEINPGSAKFNCENETTLQSQAYIIVAGAGSKSFKTTKLLNRAQANKKDRLQKMGHLLFQNPRTQAVMIFKYDDRASSYKINRRLMRDIQSFVHKITVDELILLGISAGGNLLAKYSENIPFDGEMEIHTISSPLNGYSLARFGQPMIEHFAPAETYGSHGFYREIGAGMQAYAPAPGQIRVYHHKEGSTADNLISHCGQFRGHCDPLKIQYNNVPGSQEFYASAKLDTFSVLGKILKCRNP